jgi:YVTN family beta-propeller protein
MRSSSRLRVVTFAIASLMAINIVLTLLFLVVLFGGPLTDDFKKYITKRLLYAPPILASLVSLSPVAWAIIKGWLTPHLPSPTSLVHSTFSTIGTFVERTRRASIPVIAILALLAWTQVGAVNNVCSPSRDPSASAAGKMPDAEGMALSDDEGALYLADGTSSITIAAALPVASPGIGPTYRPVKVIPVDSSPQGIARTPDGRFLYVANGGSGTVSVIDLARYTVAKSLLVGQNPRWVAISPIGDRVYVSNVYGYSVSVIDVTKQAVIGEIKGVNCPEGLAVSPDGTRLYVASQCGAGHDPLFVFDTKTNRLVAQIRGLAVGTAVVVSRDGKKVYVTRGNFTWRDPSSGKIGAPLSVVDATSYRIIKTLILQVSSSGLALTPDGKYLLATNGYQLSVIDTQTDELVSDASLRTAGSAIVVRSDNTVIVAVDDQPGWRMFPLEKALRHWPCESL